MGHDNFKPHKAARDWLARRETVGVPPIKFNPLPRKQEKKKTH
jgi:hypothetical protein